MAILTVAAVAVIGCNKSGDADDVEVKEVELKEVKADAKPETLGDSLAYYMGKLMGWQIGAKENKLPNGKDLNVKLYEKGLKAALQLDTAQISYLMGLQQGVQIAIQSMDYDAAGIKFNNGMFYAQVVASDKDSVDETTMQLTYGKLQEAGMKANEKMMAKRQADLDKKSKTAMEEAKKKYPAMKTTASGLGFIVNDPGKGEPVASEDVQVIYTGMLLDGSTFDSSNGQAVSFNVNRVIPGFTEGLKMMAPGSKYTFIVPDNLGYNGRGPAGEGGVMVFDVEMVGPSTK